jgi:hypothetical protein
MAIGSSRAFKVVADAQAGQPGLLLEHLEAGLGQLEAAEHEHAEADMQQAQGQGGLAQQFVVAGQEGQDEGG